MKKFKNSKNRSRVDSQSLTNWLFSSLTFFLSRKLALLSIVTTLLLLPFLSISAAFAANLADNNDVFELISPLPNQTVKGTIQVSIKGYDDDQSNIQFTSKLFDVETCHNQPLGSITAQSQIPSSSTQAYKFNWDTTKTTNISKINDGSYCLETCLFLQNNSNPYSACKSRTINIRNNNKPPIINSQPNNLTINEGQRFSYQVSTTDPEGDKLTYRFIITNDQFAINSNGLVTSNALSTNGASSISIPIKIAVNDGFGGEAQQSFTVIVRKVGNTQQPPVTEEGEVEPEPDTEEPPLEFDIDIENFSFISPTKDVVISENAFFIEWENLDSTEPIDLELAFKKSTDLTWKTIDNISNEQEYFLWDISELEDSKYQVRISFLDEQDDDIRLVSDIFEVKKTITDDDTTVKSIPLIKNLKPENNAVLKNAENVILSADYLASEGSEILTAFVEIKLDGKIITPSCNISTSSFSCPLDENTVSGRHIISIKVKDSADKEATLESIFKIEAEEAPPTSLVESSTDGEAVNILGLKITKAAATLIGLICLIAGLVLFIPWILYSLWIRDRSKQIKSTVYVNEPVENLSTENLPNVNVFVPDTQSYDPVNTYVQPIQEYPTTDYSYVPEPTTQVVDPYVAPYAPDVNVNVNIPPAPEVSASDKSKENPDQFVEPTQTS